MTSAARADLGRIEGADRYWVVVARGLWREAAIRVPLVRSDQLLLNEFPKSGGTWLCRMLRDLTGRQFADNALPTSRRGIVKQHSQRDYQVRRRVIVWRDPRDIMVSLYHHCFFIHEDYPFNHVSVARARDRYAFDNYEDVAANLDTFVRDQFVEPITPPFTLDQFGRKWSGADAVHVRYEDLRSDPVATLDAVVRGLGIEQELKRSTKEVAELHQISKPTSAAPSKSFVRRGKVGGFADDMPPELADFVFDSCQPWVEKLGYRRNPQEIQDAPWT